MRLSLVLGLVFLTACGRAEREKVAAVEAAIRETSEGIERALAASLQATERSAATANRTLSPLPVMTPAEENALRRFLNASHVAQARAVGFRVGSSEARDSLVARGDLVPLPDSTSYWIVRPGTAPTHVVPAVEELLTELGRRFQGRLADLDLPPYRIEVTSALRTSERQARLRGSNANAAAGASSHEFGTTVDLSYAAFAPPADPPQGVLEEVPVAFHPYVERMAELALESVSGRKSRELGKIFSEILTQAQTEGLVLVIYERQQTVYHITVGTAQLVTGTGSP